MFNLKKPSIMQLIYMSTPLESVSEADLLTLVRDAQKYNTSSNISGFLIADTKNIVQLIEGSQKDVNNLFDKIKKDIRHTNIEVLYKETSNERVMPFLGMGLCFINSMINFNYDFYYTRLQAQEFSGLIDGKVGSFFRQYLV